jgi:hypothetical protein
MIVRCGNLFLSGASLRLLKMAFSKAAGSEDPEAYQFGTLREIRD